MEEKNMLNSGNIIEIELLRFCFGPLISHGLAICKKEWNEHRIRKQKAIHAPSGIPNILYYWPERYGGVDCKIEVNLNTVDRLIDQFTIKPRLFNSKITDLVKMIFPEIEVPCTPEKAFILFQNLKEIFQENNLFTSNSNNNVGMFEFLY